jgi:hypothetical protein
MDSNGATQMRFNHSNVTDAGVGGVRIGDRVRWTSAAGDIRGEIVGMRLGLSSAGTLVPWVMIEYYNLNGNKRVELCGSESALKALHFRVLFRDKEVA